jgi:hypothetical protein
MFEGCRPSRLSIAELFLRQYCDNIINGWSATVVGRPEVKISLSNSQYDPPSFVWRFAHEVPIWQFLSMEIKGKSVDQQGNQRKTTFKSEQRQIRNRKRDLIRFVNEI